jgi:hypothetical protein
MKNFILMEKTDENLNEKKDTNSFVQKLDTSFVMLIFLTVYFLITLLFIYQGRHISNNYRKYLFLKDIFDVKDVKDNLSLFRFLSNKILFPYYKYSSNNNIDSYDDYNEDLIDVFNKLKQNNYLTVDDADKIILNKKELNKSLFNDNKNIAFFTFASVIKMVVSKSHVKNCEIPKIVKEININYNTTNNKFNQRDQEIINKICYENYYSSKTAEKSDLNLKFTLRNNTEIIKLKQNYNKSKSFSYNYEKNVNFAVINILKYR